MNRRSLLLGSVVASVAGILGVKAEAETGLQIKFNPSSELYAKNSLGVLVSPQADGSFKQRPLAMADFEVDRSWLLDKLEHDPAIQAKLVERTKQEMVTILRTDMPHWGLVKTGSDLKFVRITDS